MSITLIKPIIGSTSWGTDVNNNWDILMKALSGDPSAQTLGYLTFGGVTASISPAGTGILCFDSSAKVFKVSEDGSNPLPLGLVEFGIFGDGSDGAVTIASNTTLSRSMYYSSLTINSGITLNSAGCRIFCTGLITNNGIIQMDGGSGGNGSATFAGSAGAAAASIEFISGTAGGVGGIGRSATGTGGNGGSGVALTGDGGAGSAGGAGGAAGSCSGGTAGIAGVLTRQKVRFLTPFLLYTSGTSVLQVGGGAGSGGGGGGAASGACGGGGGGGGAGGGIVWIAAKDIINNQVISSKGGNGGAGANGSFGIAGGGGGGSGGGGGYMMLIYQTLTGTGTISIAGGTAGAGGTGLGGGGVGGISGTAGSTGTLLKFNLLKGKLD